MKLSLEELLDSMSYEEVLEAWEEAQIKGRRREMFSLGRFANMYWWSVLNEDHIAFLEEMEFRYSNIETAQKQKELEE